MRSFFVKIALISALLASVCFFAGCSSRLTADTSSSESIADENDVDVDYDKGDSEVDFSDLQ